MNWCDSLCEKINAVSDDAVPQLRKAALLQQAQLLADVCQQLGLEAPEPTFDNTHGSFRIGWWRRDTNSVLRIDVEPDGLAVLCLPEQDQVRPGPTRDDLVAAVTDFFAGWTPPE